MVQLIRWRRQPSTCFDAEGGRFEHQLDYKLLVRILHLYFSAFVRKNSALMGENVIF